MNPPRPGAIPRALPCLLALSCLAGLSAQEAAITLDEDQREVFAILDEFDPLDTSKLPFIVVVFTSGAERRERYGFLESSSSRQFSVRYVDLDRAVLGISQEQELREGIRFEPTDLRAAVARLIDRDRKRAENPLGNDGVRLISTVPPPIEKLLLARACARSGFLAEMNSLWKLLPDDWRTRDGLTRACLDGLADALDDRLLLDYTDPRLDWAELLARHNKWLAAFPDHLSKKNVEERREGLAELREAQRRRTSIPRGTSPSPADLVFDLHDEFHADLDNLYFDASTSACPEPRPPLGQRPTDRLIALDLDAVPALIEALADESPTRTVAYSSRHGGHFWVEPVATLAECALIEIAGWQPGSRGKAEPWREWFLRARKDGMRKLLLEGVNSLQPLAIEGFLRRWPKELDAVLDAVRRQAPSDADHIVFHTLMRPDGTQPDERVVALCVEITRMSTNWWTQLMLAKLLERHGNTGGVAPVLATWKASLDAGKAAKHQENPEDDWVKVDGGQLLQFLVESGDPEAWRAIVDECSTVEARRALACQLLAVPWSTIRKRVTHAAAAEVESQFRKCLMLLLADDAHAAAYGARFRHGDRLVAMHAASCADVAACVLADNWPNQFAFDAARTEKARRRQIMGFRGKPVEPLPANRAPADETPEQALVRANRLTKVTLDASADALDAAAQDRIRALQGTPLTADGLIDVAILTASAAKGRGVSFVCERTGEDDGTWLTVAIRPVFTSDSTDGWAARLLVTAGGEQLGSEALGVTSGKLERVDQLEGHGNYLGAIRKALACKARTGVEITLALRTE